MLEIGAVLHCCEISAVFAIIGHQGEVLRLVEIIAAAIQTAFSPLVNRVHDRLVVLLCIETLYRVEVENCGVPGGRAERVVQVVELYEQDLIKAFLSLRSMAPHSLKVVAEIAAHLLLSLINELFLLVFILLVYLNIGIVLLQKRFCKATASIRFRLCARSRWLSHATLI